MPVEQYLEVAQNTSFKDVLVTFFTILQYPAITLFTAMLLEIVLPIGNNLRLQALTPFFRKLAKKVNRAENSAAQNLFSSVFLPFLLISIALFILLLLRFCIDHETILSLLILPFLLESKPILKTALAIKTALANEDKTKAKALLQPHMQRDCSKLSAMGINKALCEAVGMSMFINWFAVMVWYLLLGIEGAVLMQLVAVMNKAFSIKQKEYQLFGSFIYKFEQALLLPCTIAFFIVSMFSVSVVRILKNIKTHFKTYSSLTSGLILDILGSYANVSLGGPRYYSGNLIRLSKIGGQNEPEDKSPLKIYNKVRFTGILFVCICVLIKTYLYAANIH